VHIYRNETHLSTVSSGFERLMYFRALVRWSLSMTASWRSLPIRRFFSFTSFSNGSARSRFCFRLSSSDWDPVEASSATLSCLRTSSSWVW